MRLYSHLPLLALLVVQAVGQSQVTSEDPARDAGSTSNSTAATRPRIPSQEEMDVFYMMFPALGSLLRWGSLFPAQSILGAMPDNLQPAAAASKVVLVLADDATAKTRVVRQNPPLNPLGQLMNWPALPQDFQLPSMDLGPQVGSFLAQLPPMPAIPSILGAAAPVPAPAPAPAAAPLAPAAAADPPAAPAPDAAQPAILGQAALQNAFTFLNPSNFDASGLLGQSAPTFAPPNFDFVAQMQRQFFPGMTPAQQPAPAGTDAQASDISEVRVRPEAPYSQEAQMSQMKIQSALEREQERQQEAQLKDQEQVPLLWFRMPTTQNQDATEEKTLEDLRVEAKLRAFERQVISELKMLQKIELMAKQMRSSASAQNGDSPYRINYPLSRTPIHKITRADIEQALRDDYVRRLVNKEAQRRAGNSGMNSQKANALKRQAKSQEQALSKEDIVQIMAYAYRMANEQMESEKGKQDKVYAAYRTEQSPMTMEQRQWSEDQAKIQQNPQQIQQGPMMMQQRQSAEDQAKMQQSPMMMQQGPMMMQQRQSVEDQAKMQQSPMMMQQSPMMMQQRQSAEDQAKMQQSPMMMQQSPMMMQQSPMMMQQSPMMMQQRQWTEDQAKMQHDQQMAQQMAQQGPMMMEQRQRQWSEDQAKVQQAQQMAQQTPMMMPQMQQRQWTEDPQMVQQMQQRQWTEEQARMQMAQQRQMAENPQMMQQRQWSEEQNKIEQQQMAQQNQMMMHQMQQMQQRQWTEDQAKTEQQQRQMMQQTPMMMKQRQWAQENPQSVQQQVPLMMQQQAPMTMQRAVEEQDNEAEDQLVGEAGPQMPENENGARHKVDALGLGGNKRKKSKSKSARPTVINYYYAAPQRPAVQSYGTSYGGGGYGSNAYGVQQPVNAYQSQGYRAAVGNEEVDEMLRRHQTMARTIIPKQPGHVGGSESQESSSNPPATLTPALEEPPQEHRVHKRLALLHRFGQGTGVDATASKSCGCGTLDCLCGRSCGCGKSGSRTCQCKANRRNKRSVEYGTLETIDEGSLNELRREYKLGLKEITLNPDEDPAEALMRYNAASIREALERASMVPLEIGGDQYEEDAQHEPMQEEQLQHDPSTEHQYNHKNFVRLTASTASPITSTSTTAAVTPRTNDSTSEAPEATTTSTTTTTESTKDEGLDMLQDSQAAADSSPVTKSISKQEMEIHQLHSIVDELKNEILKLNLRCSKIISNTVAKEPVPEQTPPVVEEPSKQEETPKVEKEKVIAEEQAPVEQEEEQEEDEDSTSTSTTTETPSPSSSYSPKPELKPIPAIGSPTVVEHIGSSNKLDYEDDTNWQRILANRGYDMDYLTKSHERQFSQGQNLEMPKNCNYDGNGSQEYGPYPEFQADEPSSDTEGKTKRALSVKQQAQLLNAALNDSGSDSSDASTTTTTLSPYALRGKFVSRRSTATRTPIPRTRKASDEVWVRSPRQVKMPQRPKMSMSTPKKYSTQVTTQATVSSTKLDSLVDVLKDLLRLQIQKEKKSSLLRTQSSDHSKTPKSIKPIKVIKRKRLRRRQHKSIATTIRSPIHSKA
ncbi:defective chorion-1 protein, FC177 isoform isoform X2 [Drosophila erecta]|uniref:Defective chorion 1, isoform C n=1 Tax=Drosophila erecta TaxID=7220 RepID=A0A0Q5T5T3_DROER|nr:defective chorion-1 protein, FC177 isoform isoform X2 [Drosophila erecta]KQS30541.1 defective chorion 1, isoform C [Drosophila erecta]